MDEIMRSPHTSTIRYRLLCEVHRRGRRSSYSLTARHGSMDLSREDRDDLHRCMRRHALSSNTSSMGKFVSVLKTSPPAAAKVLDLLNFRPQVKDRQRNPLPRFAVLHNDVMHCSIVPAPLSMTPVV